MGIDKKYFAIRILTVVSLFTMQTFAASLGKSTLYSNSEGAVSFRHVHDLNVYRQKYFYNSNGEIDLVKIDQLTAFLNQQKNLLLNSAKLSKKTNLIFNHGYEQIEAEKKGLQAQDEEAESIAPILFALEHVEDLKKNISTMTNAQIHEKVETILLFVAAGYTVYPEGIFTTAIDRSKSLLRNFFDFKKNDQGLVQASNLIDPQTKGFLSDAQITKLQSEGKDISQLNPPSSAFWTDNDIESYDPLNEIYWGKQLFPDKDIAIPVFKYKRMGNGNIKIKIEWTDEKDLNKKGEPKKKDVTIRLGHEAYATPISSHLARIIGYPANPNIFRKKIKLELGKTSFEQFVNEWLAAHGSEQGSPLTHIERIKGENAVYIKNANLEAYPENDVYRKMGPFRMGDNGLNNRREYRALVLYNALISLEDQFEYQTRVDAYRENKKSLWQPLFYISDVGQSLGIPTWGNTGTVNEYTWNFTWQNDSEVKLFWISIFNSRTWEKTTYSDVKWMARRMARIKSSQIDDILRASGMPAPAQALYAEKIKSRLNKMIKDFDLDKEGFIGHNIKTPAQLAAIYPKYIDQKGYLKDGAQQIEGNTIPILGNAFTPYQMIKSYIFNTFTNTIGKLISEKTLTEKITSGGLAEFNLGQVESETGKIYEASRKVSVNNEIGPNQRRYKIKDTLSIGVPIGFNNDRLQTPASLYYLISFDYIYSVDTLRETLTKNFFKRLNPAELGNIKENLKNGEQLYINHSYGASIGEVKVKLLEQLQVEAALIGLSRQKIKTMYFTKSDTLLEAFTTNYTGKGFKTGFDIRAAVRLALNYQKNKSESTKNYYKIDLLNQTDQEIGQSNGAFTKALVDNDFTDLDQLSPPLKVEETTIASHLGAGLFVWNRDSTTSVSDLNIQDKNIILAHKNVSHDRAFDRVWNNKKSGADISVLNFAGNLTNEGQSMDIAFEGALNAENNQFDKFEVNLSFSASDRYTTKKEFYNSFVKYFNERSGEKTYIDFVVPERIEQYLNLSGLMRWQLSSKAVIMLLKAITNKQNLSHIPSMGRSKNQHMDQQDILVMRANKILAVLEKPDQKQITKKQLQGAAKATVEVIEAFVGSKGQNVAQIRKYVADKDLWIVTSIENMLDLTNPTFRPRQDYWAPEIGQFQGHSDLDIFRRTRLQAPIL